MDNNKTKKTPTICSNCGGQLEVDETKEVIECPYCGTKYHVADLLNQSDTLQAEKIKSQTYKEVELHKIQHAYEKEQREEEKSEIKKFKKSITSKFLVLLAIISGLLCITAFKNVHLISGIIGLIMTAFFILSFLMGMHLMKEKKSGIRTIIMIIALVLFIPFFKFNSAKTDSNYERFKWDTVEMHSFLPEPSSCKGHIYSNSNTNLILELVKVSNDEYKDYVQECIKKGFTLDSEKEDTSYEAFNQKGYKLKLSYLESNKEMTINLDEPIKMSQLEWPSNGLASLIPAPKSNYGNVTIDNAETFTVFVGNTPISDFNAYVKDCSSKGFDLEHNKTDKTYSAKNAKGNKLHLEYNGFNTMVINIYAPAKQDTKKEDTPKEKTETPEAETPNKNNSNANTVSPDFKKAMDSYEKTINNYVEFMKKYNNSDDVASMLSDYTTYFQQYTDTMSKLSAIDENKLSTADSAYYLEVQTRISNKLLEVTQ